MFGQRWFPWINGPTAAAAVPMTSDKQEQDQSSECLPPRKSLICHHICPMIVLSALCCLLLVTCIALSVIYADQSSSRPEWNNLIFDYQNITENYITVSSINTELKRDNKILKDHNEQLEEQTKLLNRTIVKFMSQEIAVTGERAKLMEKIDNLNSTNAHLTEEYDKVVQERVEQEEKLVNMSRTITDFFTLNRELQLEKQKMVEKNKLLQNELVKVKDVNQQLQEEALKETEQLQEMVREISGQNQNLSSLLAKGKTDLDQYEEEQKKMVNEIQSAEEAYHSLDRYCPVVHQKTEERVCRKCAEGWVLFQTKCYYFSSRTLSWSPSRAWCQTHGADLLIINSEEEQHFIHETSQSVDQTNTRLWIGMSDREQEGDWRWIDGRPVTSAAQYWLDRPGVVTEPDDWKLDDPEGEDCGHIDISEKVLQSWMDGSCKISYRWICEMNV